MPCLAESSALPSKRNVASRSSSSASLCASAPLRLNKAASSQSYVIEPRTPPNLVKKIPLAIRRALSSTSKALLPCCNDQKPGNTATEPAQALAALLRFVAYVARIRLACCLFLPHRLGVIRAHVVRLPSRALWHMVVDRKSLRVRAGYLIILPARRLHRGPRSTHISRRAYPLHAEALAVEVAPRGSVRRRRTCRLHLFGNTAN